MRTFRVLGVFVALAVLVVPTTVFAGVSAPEAGLRADVASATPSKLCHPKKPITCRAGELAPQTAVEIPTDVNVAKTNERMDAGKPRFEFNEAMICLGPRYSCIAKTLA